MRKLLMIAPLVGGLMMACTSGGGTQGQQGADSSKCAADSVAEPAVLIGKTLMLDYGSMKARVRYEQDSLYWTTFTPEMQETGQAREIPAYEALGDSRFFVTWQEADGTAVTQIVDLKEQTVLASVLDPAQAKAGDRTPLVLVGTAKEADK